MNISMLKLQLGIMLTAAPVPDSQNLFDESWTEGNLYTIQGVVNVLGGFSVKVISIVGFGIVIFSILKNALSGLYVVNPNFWDRVDELKTQAVAMANESIQGGLQMVGSYGGQAGNVAANKLGSIFTFLLSAIPNVKALTDFDDNVPVDKKQYFMKSIPLLVAQIFIGMLIFFGYPAKIANWIGTGGTYAIQAIINNVDPIETIQKVADNITVYNLSTDGTQDPFEKVMNDATTQMMSVVSSRYTDMKKQPAQETAYAIEQYLLDNMDKDKIREILGATDGYVVSISTTARNSVPTVSANYVSLNSGGCPYMAQATNGTISYVYWISGQTLPTGSQMVDAADNFVFRFTATPVALANTSSASCIAFGGVSRRSITNNSTRTIQYNVSGLTVGKADGDMQGTLGNSVIVDHIDKDGKLTQSFTASLQSSSISQTANASPILEFSQAYKEDLDKCKDGYFKVNLVGNWSIKYKDPNNDKKTTTLKISEWRLALNSDGAKATYALSTWQDIDSKTSEGLPITTQDFLTRIKKVDTKE